MLSRACLRAADDIAFSAAFAFFPRLFSDHVAPSGVPRKPRGTAASDITGGAARRLLHAERRPFFFPPGNLARVSSCFLRGTRITMFPESKSMGRDCGERARRHRTGNRIAITIVSRIVAIITLGYRLTVVPLPFPLAVNVVIALLSREIGYASRHNPRIAFCCVRVRYYAKRGTVTTMSGQLRRHGIPGRLDVSLRAPFARSVTSIWLPQMRLRRTRTL